MWIFHKSGGNWTVRILPPAAVQPNVGYAEFAGWVPGGTQVSGGARSDRRWALPSKLRADAPGYAAALRQSAIRATLGEFQRWQDPAWKRETLAMR
jgi:hypothetical protein